MWIRAGVALNSKMLDDLDFPSGVELLTAWIESQMAYRGQPGLSIGVVYDQELVWAKGFGYADVEQKIETSSKTLYRIASITKLFTSTALMQLRDAGKLSIDDAVEEYLPWFKLKRSYTDSPPIKIWHLLTHTSGLPRESLSTNWNDSKFPSRKEVIKAIERQGAVIPTEVLWKYSNLALAIAGEVVQSVSGMAYSDYVKQNILEPLEMHSTLVESPNLVDTRLAKGYGRRYPDGTRTASPFTDSKGITPAANMTTNVEDLAKFAMLQFRCDGVGGSQILKGSTLKEMHRPHWLQPDWKEGWGIGFNIVRDGENVYVGHGGSVQGYRTLLRLNVPDKIAVIVLTNADDGNPLIYVEKALKWLTPSLRKDGTPKSGKKGKTGYQKYLGKFRNVWSDMQVLALNDQLASIDPSQPEPAESFTKLVPTGKHAFIIETESGYGSYGEKMIFEFGSDSKVTRVKVGQDYIYPVERW